MCVCVSMHVCSIKEFIPNGVCLLNVQSSSSCYGRARLLWEDYFSLTNFFLPLVNRRSGNGRILHHLPPWYPWE